MADRPGITEECEKHEMIGCQVCHPRPVPSAVPDSRPFTAHFDGQCPDCDLPIRADVDRIVLRSGSSGRYAIHEGCG